MLENRIYNFSAGPSMLPEAVLLKAQKDMLNYEGSGMSVMEMSHRSKVAPKFMTRSSVTRRPTCAKSWEFRTITRYCSSRAERPVCLPRFL